MPMKITQPPFRKLRGYAFDPLLSNQSATADINSVIYRVDWESLQPSANTATTSSPARTTMNFLMAGRHGI